MKKSGQGLGGIQLETPKCRMIPMVFVSMHVRWYLVFHVHTYEYGPWHPRSVCLCVCACVCVRERETEGLCECVCECVCESVGECAVKRRLGCLLVHIYTCICVEQQFCQALACIHEGVHAAVIRACCRRNTHKLTLTRMHTCTPTHHLQSLSHTHYAPSHPPTRMSSELYETAMALLQILKNPAPSYAQAPTPTAATAIAAPDSDAATDSFLSKEMRSGLEAARKMCLRCVLNWFRFVEIC